MRLRASLVCCLSFTAASSFAARPQLSETRSDPAGPPITQSTDFIQWIPVHPPGQSPCPPTSHADDPGSDYNDIAADEVWCFEGPGGDGTWPANPGGGTFDHWSKFAPPIPIQSTWHVTSLHGGSTTGTFNAWAGCDVSESIPGCADIGFWESPGGSGDDWNHALVLDASGQNASGGGTIAFDLRYDTECDYDYLYLEYATNTGTWAPVTDVANGTGAKAVFNSVSGNPSATVCGTDYFDNSDEDGIGNSVHGAAQWLVAVSFPIPNNVTNLKLRWRAFTDGAWSDEDGRGDTDGLAAIDNVVVTFIASGNTVSDDFETGDLNGVATSAGTPATWDNVYVAGNTYDGWHLTFDANYKNKGNTCVFGTDWMWSAKPDVGPIPANGFDYFLVTPKIDVSGWTGGVVRYAEYDCWELERKDITEYNVRVYDPASGWSDWSNGDGSFFPISGECSWQPEQVKDLAEFLTADVESLQIGWEVIDFSQPGDFTWGKHAGTNLIIDNVAIGRYDATTTAFTAREADLFCDTFSRSDAAHTAFLANAEQGQWSGTLGARDFASEESLSVYVKDLDGVTEGNVMLWWRSDLGTGPRAVDQSFEAWKSKPMHLSYRDVLTESDEGAYRQILGEDGSPDEDYDATTGALWMGGETVQYYVSVTDDASDVTTFPLDAQVPESPSYFEFSVLPFDVDSGHGERILVVNDGAGRVLDFANSSSFDPNGGTGSGTFYEPAFETSLRITERALALLYDPTETDPHANPRWDVYDVGASGTSAAALPNGLANPSVFLGGFADETGSPHYDLIVWLSGATGNYAWGADTKAAVAPLLDSGGRLLSSGDDLASAFAEGHGADPTFLATYFGIEVAVEDEQTEDLVLDVAGETGTSLDGFQYGLYGSCPAQHGFDRLLLATPAPNSVATVLATYTEGGVADDGRAAVIENVRTGGGVAMHLAFDLAAVTSNEARACILHNVFTENLGLASTGYTACVGAVGVPIVAGGPRSFALGRVAPNPFREGTIVEFQVPRSVKATIRVYDVAGRAVRTLLDGVIPPGTHHATWDGRGDDSRAVSSGIYFVRMTSEDFHATSRIVRLR